MTEETNAAKREGAQRTARARPTGKRLAKTTLSERTYEAIKERILDQLLTPGMRLNIDALSRELNVSSTPIREALARLAVERLVVLELYSGYSVAPRPSAKYFSHLQDYRYLTEGYCASVGAPKKAARTLSQMRQLIEKMASIPRIGTKYREHRRFVEHDAHFHQLVVDSAENEIISTTYASVNAIIIQSRLYLNREGGAPPSSEVVDEHRRILAAYERGDGEAAKAAICAHLTGGQRRLLSRI